MTDSGPIWTDPDPGYPRYGQKEKEEPKMNDPVRDTKILHSRLESAKMCYDRAVAEKKDRLAYLSRDEERIEECAAEVQALEHAIAALK